MIECSSQRITLNFQMIFKFCLAEFLDKFKYLLGHTFTLPSALPTILPSLTSTLLGNASQLRSVSTSSVLFERSEDRNWNLC